jgi:formamidopyrimidine-DNA glycosylase
MPELPEVETTRRLIEPLIVARTITGVEVARPRMLRNQESPADFAFRLQGRTVDATGRVGKHLMLELGGDLTWVIHLGMSGRLSIVAPTVERPRHSNVVATLDDGNELRFIDPRTFGYTVVLTREELASASFARHGPDALDALPGPAQLGGRMHGRSAPIKALLLDQTVVSGVGNIYADEALHRARISPHRPGGSLDLRELRRLVSAIRATLQAGIDAGGSTLDDLAYLLPDGRAGEYTAELRAYGREGEPCPRCGNPIHRDVIRSRSTFWCPVCCRAAEASS